MRKVNKKTASLSVGASSLLMFFVILTLTTFAALSLASANADASLSSRAVQASHRYYEADSRAEEILASIDAALIQARENSVNQPYNERCMALVNTIDDVEASVENGILITRYSVLMPNDQELFVLLHINDEASSERYTIKTWKVINTEDWDMEGNFLNLWDGGFD